MNITSAVNSVTEMKIMPPLTIMVDGKMCHKEYKVLEGRSQAKLGDVGINNNNC